MKWRLIKAKTFDAYMNMALEEAVMDEVKKGNSPPTIRLFMWKPSAVSIGYFQGLKNEVNIELCKKKKYNIVRRITGGGTVFHDTNGEVTYSIIAPEKLFPKDVSKSYEEICGYIVDALESLGINAQYKKINDVLVDGCKISGSAQTRKGGILLQHGTLMHNIDPVELFSLLAGRPEKNKLTKSNKKVVTCVIEHKDVNLEKVKIAMEKAFTKNKEFSVGDYSKEELEHAEFLVKTKYKTDEWNNLR